MPLNFSRERGNALFLILIAVILFAALSYAITQSNRSGGDPARETTLVASTTVTQYPAAVHTAITRMMLRGVAEIDLDYTPPSDPTFNNAPVTNKVFHPNGGGAVWQNADPNTVTLDSNGVPEGSWNFVTVKEIEGLGTAYGETLAILTHVRKGVCEAINEKLTGSKTIPGMQFDEANLIQAGMDPIGDSMVNNNMPPGGLSGRPFLCIGTESDVPIRYNYYHVIVEP